MHSLNVFMMMKNESCAKAIDSLTLVPVFSIDWLKCTQMQGGGEILFDQVDESQQLVNVCIFNQNGYCSQRLTNLSFPASCWISSYAENSCDLFDRAVPSSTLDLPFVVRLPSDASIKYIVAGLVALIAVLVICVVSLVRKYLAISKRGALRETASEVFDEDNDTEIKQTAAAALNQEDDDVPGVFNNVKL